jgi:hypothetical protein
MRWKVYRILLLWLGMSLLAAGCNLAAPQDTPSNGEEQLEIDAPELSPTQPLLVTRTAMPTALPIPTAIAQDSGPSGPQPQQQQQQPPQPAQLAAPALESPAGNQRAYGLRIDDGLRGSGVTLLDTGIDHYAQNPANPNRYSVIDSAGMLYITDTGGANAYRIEQGPYTQFPASSREGNNAAAISSVWSPDGRYLAFIVSARQQPSDGVWYFQPGDFAPLQLVVDCPSEGFIGCNIVRPPDRFRLWESREVHWSPDSETLLINVNLPGEGRRGLLVQPITRFERIRDERPPVLLYDYGTWASDGRILASGRNPDGVGVVAFLNRDGSVNQQVFNPAASGLWMGWAVQRPDGSVVALGAPGDAGGPRAPIAIYDMNGNALTGAITGGFPQRVSWSPDRRAVLVESDGRQYVATIDGQITEITGQTGGRAVNWTR